MPWPPLSFLSSSSPAPWSSPWPCYRLVAAPLSWQVTCNDISNNKSRVLSGKQKDLKYVHAVKQSQQGIVFNLVFTTLDKF